MLIIALAAHAQRVSPHVQDCTSVAARVFIKKLCYILRLRSLKDTSNIASSLFYTTNTLQLSLVGECRFLEDHLGFKEFAHRDLSGEYYDGSRRHM